jgi:hypothetical protein
MYHIDNKIPMPKLRRVHGSKTPQETKLFEAFVIAYREAHKCTLLLGTFDSESRVQVFKGPTFSIAHTARRCKELMRLMK